jgi:DinB superfamily
MSATKATSKSKSTPSIEDPQTPLREQLVALLKGGQAHATLDEAIKDFPAKLRGTVPANLPYSAWQLLEHLRIGQRDILDFSAPPTGGYHPIPWPDGYWPKSPEPPSAHAWDATIATIHKDQKLFEDLITKPAADLYKPFRWGDGQNLLREALLVADHNAYHIGALVLLRRLLGCWHK